MQLYAKLFRAGNALQQLLPGGQAYWHQTQHMSTMAIAFHMNFNYVWLHLLKCALPGHAWCTILAKVCVPGTQSVCGVSAFYANVSIQYGKDGIFLDMRQKFWDIFKSSDVLAGLMYWPFVQLANFSLVPIHWRTPYTVPWFSVVTFLCFSQQHGDGM
ncbi:LOW QUALITY PROTEIN: mpv17-like protein [Camelus ferus]|uniref:LOW QUALITY PROTEIN: mpv17-like protein n=1 Tax=Camelus ferus TaxID=419612 RepID=A0A8B8SK15_CAMFR|nr:LOW QUALITY PROTEIN: mpv17-like protein [Camelus ferus]